MSRKFLSSGQEDELVVMYESGKTQTEIAKHFKIKHVGMVADYLKSNHVPIRGHSEETRTYTLNERCLKNAESRESASWLIGLFLADGHIRESPTGQKFVCLSLAEFDRDGVDKFASILQTNQPIKLEKYGSWAKGNAACLRVTSSVLFDAMNSYGVTPRKTGTEKLDKRLEFNRHAWRGIIDGDGFITQARSRKGGAKRPAIGLASSSEVLLDQFVSYTCSICGKSNKVTRTIMPSFKSYYAYTLTGASALSVITELYRDSTFHLRRKYLKALEAMKYVPRNGGKVRWGHKDASA
jgi:hypothetical protein